MPHYWTKGLILCFTRECILPEHPPNGKLQVPTQPSYIPGNRVTSGVVLIVSCEEGYKVHGNLYSFCLNGQWAIPLGHCEELCPILSSNDAIKVTCTMGLPSGGNKVVNCSEAINGTVARFDCETFYEKVKFNQDAYSICSSGRWNPEKPNCNPVCGRRAVQATQLISGGKVVSKGNYPWQIAIYRTSPAENYLKFICGGSLLNQRVILTAAHCVTDRYGNKLSKDRFSVAAGKFYREIDDPRDTDVQKSTVKDIYVPELYKADLQNYRGDIAIIVTVKIFTLTKWIQPVCVDWGRDYDEEFLNSRNTGYVSGWGLQSNNPQLSETLQELEVPYIPTEQCRKDLPQDYTVYLTEDKLCSGYVNKSASVCEGDSGGGLVSKSRLDGKFYVTGVVSVAPRGSTSYCNSQDYALYTKVSTHIRFIVEKEIVNRPPAGTCVLMEHPFEGKWIIQGSMTKQPGDFVNSSTVLRVQCDKGAVFLKGEEYITCLDGTWSSDIGTCEGKKRGDNGEPTTTTKPPHIVDSCVLPAYPTSGSWQVAGPSNTSELKPEDRVTLYTLLMVSCDVGYKLLGDSYLLCSNGVWSSEIGICSKLCPPAVKGLGVSITSCTLNLRTGGYDVVDCNEAVNSTLVKFECRPHSKEGYGICLDGRWNPPVLSCETACGESKAKSIGSAGSESVIPTSEHPWQVAIYTNRSDYFIPEESGPDLWTLHCAGTLINPRVIVTAAHCVVQNGLSYRQIEPLENLQAAVAKRYPSINDTRDSQAQFSRIKHILIPEEYKGILRRYQADIAVLVTEELFTFNDHVQPICIDWSGTYDQRFFDDYRPAHIPGWSDPSKLNPEGALAVLVVPYRTNEACSKEVTLEFYSELLLWDKVCAGFLNNTAKGACTGSGPNSLGVKGFSGTGMIFRNRFEGRDYLAAVLSSAPRDSHSIKCSLGNLGIYTMVSKYLKWFLIEKELQYRPLPKEIVSDNSSQGSCQLPNYPQHGTWQVRGKYVLPGMWVDQETVLRVSCDYRYKLSGSALLICSEGEWSGRIGSCSVELCPSLEDSDLLNVTCSLNGKQVECYSVQIGTVASFKCAPMHEDLILGEHEKPKCDATGWVPDTPKCTRMCGKKPSSSETVTTKNKTVAKTQYPWVVAIYKQVKDKGKVFVCSGTLISLQSVITSAHCVTDTKGTAKSHRIFRVTTGKFFRKFNDTRDTNTQYSHLQSLHVHPSYTGVDHYEFVSAIAVLVTKKEFVPSELVMPICIDYNKIYNPFSIDPSGTGIVVDWGYKVGGKNETSETLKEVTMPYVPYDQCQRELPKQYDTYLTFDAMCTGRSSTDDTATCPGDYGAGLYFKSKVNNRYFLAGVMSHVPAPRNESCNNQHLTLFTKIAPYKEFILEKSLA